MTFTTARGKPAARQGVGSGPQDPHRALVVPKAVALIQIVDVRIAAAL